MIQAESVNVKRDEYLKRLMRLSIAIQIAAICLPNIAEGSNCILRHHFYMLCMPLKPLFSSFMHLLGLF
jgi:hypothetical protein